MFKIGGMVTYKNNGELIFPVHFHACSRICLLASEHMNELMNEFRVLNELMNEHMNELMTQLVMNGENYLLDVKLRPRSIVGRQGVYVDTR